MVLFNIKEKDFSIIINEMEQDVENVDPISFIKAYHIRSIMPTYIHLIEKLLGSCPKSWFKDIKFIAYEIAERQIEEAKEMALPPQLYDILEKNLYKREQVRCLKGGGIISFTSWRYFYSSRYKRL